MMYAKVLLLLWGVVSVEGYRTAESRLYDDLIASNNPNERPVYNKSEIIIVQFDFFLRRIIRFEEVEQQLVCTGLFLFSWMDQFLKWDRSTYNVSSIVPAATHIWRPPLVVSNSFQQLDYIGGDFVRMRLSSNGQVNWLPGDVYRIPCDIELQRYPFDSISCTMEILVLGLSEDEVVLRYKQAELDTSVIKQNGQWNLLSAKISAAPLKKDKYSLPRYTITFLLDRKPINFIFSFLVPVIILSLISTFVFLIPSDSGEKLSFAITIPLSYGVYMGFLTIMVPQTSDGVSLFVIFLGITLATSSLFVILSIFSVRTCRRSNAIPIPRLLVSLTLWIEGIKTCGRVKPTPQLPKVDENDKIQKPKSPVVTWKRVSRALDLFWFWIVFTGFLASCLGLTLFSVL